ncbi:interleukin-17C-like [Saccoglossus kowalevskii]|uniref:Uncharacterized protein LOC102806223 n=1 Tax=Saccoglossus kowalevskii TaxID=10224 RepID=A0ABM0MTB6_SACKO|nr:PREDICTED: uncharacterized protein LOC102806223 [Saccoglossus kowalevskii]
MAQWLYLVVLAIPFSAKIIEAKPIEECKEPVIGKHSSKSLYPYTDYLAIMPFPVADVPKGVHTQSSAVPPRIYRSDNGMMFVSPQERSNCPFYYTYEEDADRIPRTLAHATCSCDKCIGEDGGTSPLYTCQQIIYPVPVMKRSGCVDGLFKYHLQVQEVAVSCACLRPKETTHVRRRKRKHRKNKSKDVLRALSMR